MSRTMQTLYAVDPAGVQHSIRTSAGYAYAGLLRTKDGSWKLVAKGWSVDSVRSRTVTVLNRTVGALQDTVVPLRDRVQLKAQEYFGQLDAQSALGTIKVTEIFTPAFGWSQLRQPVTLTEAQLRSWQKDNGVTAITVTSRSGRTPDFTVEELLKTDRRPLLGGSLIGSRR